MLMMMILKVILPLPFHNFLFDYLKTIFFFFFFVENMNDVGKLCMPSLTKLYIFVVADDEEDMLEHYLAEKTDSSSHS